MSSDSASSAPITAIDPTVTPLDRIVFERFTPLEASAATLATRSTLTALFATRFETFGGNFEDPLDEFVDIEEYAAESDPPEGAAILLMPVPETIDPALERALENVLPEPSRARLRRFANPRRRHQSLLGRLLAQRLANDASEVADAAFFLRERPPEGPLLADFDGRPVGRFAVAHTDLGVAVALSRRPMGIDLETRRMRARLPELSRFALGESFAHTIDTLLARDSERALDVFFGAWGAIESEQKMNGEDRDSASAAAAPEFDGMLRKYARPKSVEISWNAETPGIRTVSPTGDPVPLEFLETSLGLLTLLGAPATRSIEFLTLTPEELLEAFEHHVRSFL